MSGFGKHSGPTSAPKSANPFQFQRPPHPPPSSAAPVRPSRGIEAVNRVQSPLSAFENSSNAVRPQQYGGVQRPIESPPRWAGGQSPLRDYDAQTHLRPPAVTSFVASRNSENSVTAKVARFQESKRTRSPPSSSTDNSVLRNSSHTIPQRPSFYPPMQHNPKRFPATYSNLPTHQDESVVSSHVSADYRKSFVNELPDMQAPKEARSPHTQPAGEVTEEHHQFARNGSKRPSGSPPRLGTKSNILPSSSDALIHPRSSPSADDIASTAMRNTGLPVSKRTRSPPLIYRDEFLQENSSPIEDDTERELQAKAKRLARFRAELSDTVQMSPPDIAYQRLSSNRYQLDVQEKKKHVGENASDSAGDFLNDTALSDFEGMEASRVIIGLCSDMCPETERAERERKGDLDQYERVDGDRNQTSEFLAVKKYNRTAEREANLIRPMPVLQKTIDYLLRLLDQAYDDRFLGIYNFLWDRMRAIRMDLRMQHIFDQGAITMLEQMIRLHIIAMHELCEYTKGEGFSEGFDAHLNIEQMNKTSVELFQMYDDHRKKGITVPTEKEFRGYYALLKLDKHPGYKVEPAELSLDLAKMTPEIRQTPEVLFARDVARACRTGNFVAFFRLARRASYLQACLMHAHFAKLRTQAFASLHSSLQSNQGLPVCHIARWLAIEEEDIESLLDYYGFSIKEFEEPYMVKDGPFLNAESDYPTKCSILVHLKRSRTIAEDVAFSREMTSFSIRATKDSQLGQTYKQKANASLSPRRATSILSVDDEMPDSKVVPSTKDVVQLHPVTETSMSVQQLQDSHLKTSVSFKSLDFSLAHSSPRSPSPKVAVMEKAKNDALFTLFPDRTINSSMEQMPLQVMSQASLPQRTPSDIINHAGENAMPQSMAIDSVKSLQVRTPTGKYDYVTKNSVSQPMAINDLNSLSERKSENYEYASENSVPQGIGFNDLGDEPLDGHLEIENREIVANSQDKEVADAKLKLILRLWRRRAAKRRELREKRQLASEAALSSLPLGIPVRQNKNQWSTFGELDFDHAMRERGEKQERSWSRLNVSDVVSGILSERNPDAKCLCWKIVLCSPESNQGDRLMQKSQVTHLAAGSWLFSKIMPSTEDHDADDLAMSSPGLSIWKKWVPSLPGADLACCLSVVKDANSDNLTETMSGASAVLFLVSDSIPWKLQKVQLHNLLTSITPGSCLPLLVLSGSYNVEDSDHSSVIINELGLNDIDKSRVSNFLVVFLVGKQYLEHSNWFFCDEQLRKGLKWLANESPVQPVLSSVKVRELVISHLNPLLEALDRSDYEVGPNHFISVFNEALDWSLGEIAAAVKANPTNWPCPETMLLEDSSDELLAVKLFLPSVGWSSPAKTAPLECALRNCRLPSFPDDISWLQRGSKMGKDIDNHRLLLEKCLIGYLTQSSKMMGIPLATNETSVMLQRNIQLELRNMSYFLVPDWVTIFRRIFNWRLMNLSTGACSLAYILQCHHVAPKSGDLLNSQHGADTSTYSLTHPSLDEIIEVGCSALKSQRDGMDPQSSQLDIPFSIEGEAATRSISTKNKGDSSQEHRVAIADEVANTNTMANNSYGEKVVARAETDRLSQLLEKCNIVQNGIGEKLSIYF